MGIYYSSCKKLYIILLGYVSGCVIQFYEKQTLFIWPDRLPVLIPAYVRLDNANIL